MRTGSLRAVLAAVTVAFGLSGSALAGLDFTDTVTIDPANTTPGVQYSLFGGPLVTSGSTTLPNGFVTSKPDAVTISVTTAIFESAQVIYSYNGLFDNVIGADYTTDHGDDNYTMVLQLGTVTGSVFFNTIQFHNRGGAFSNAYHINQTLTAADSDRLLFVNIPAAIIPIDQRNYVDQVALSFTFFGDTGASVGLNALANPEPGTLALFGAGLLGLAGAVRVRRRRRAATPAAQ